MSGWQAYVNTLLDSSADIKRAAIIGLDGAIWASTDGDKQFKATPAELAAFAQLFENVRNVPSVGADLEGIHYIVPQVEENLIFGKRDRTGFFAYKTKTAVLIGVFEGESSAVPEARQAVEKLGEYLETTGY